MPTTVTVLPPTHAIAVENRVTGNKCPKPRPYMLYQIQLQTYKLIRKMTILSPMIFTRCKQQSKESMLNLTLVLHHHLHQSTSDFSGRSCNTIHVNDLNQLPPIQIEPSVVLFKTHHANQRPSHTALHSTWLVLWHYGSSDYFSELLCPTTRPCWQHTPGNSKVWCGHTNTLHNAPALPLPPPGELTFAYIKSAYPNLFKGLSELDEPFSLTLNPDIWPIPAAPHRYAAPKLPIIKKGLRQTC